MSVKEDIMEFTIGEIDTAIKDIKKDINDDLLWATRFKLDKIKRHANSLTIALKALEELREEVEDREIQKKLYGADMPKETYEKYIDMLNKRRGQNE